MKTLTAKVFKSGNSKAVRLPSSLGVKAKSYNVVPTASGLMLIDPAAAARRAKAFAALYGSCPDFPEADR